MGLKLATPRVQTECSSQSQLRNDKIIMIKKDALCCCGYFLKDSKKNFSHTLPMLWMFSHFENLNFWPMLSYSDSDVF